jgi:hypothetical protein
MSVCKQQPFCGKFINGWRLNRCCSIATHIAVAQIIHVNYNDIRFACPDVALGRRRIGSGLNRSGNKDSQNDCSYEYFAYHQDCHIFEIDQASAQ